MGTIHGDVRPYKGGTVKSYCGGVVKPYYGGELTNQLTREINKRLQ